jgi:hypothetical protein
MNVQITQATTILGQAIAAGTIICLPSELFQPNSMSRLGTVMGYTANLNCVPWQTFAPGSPLQAYAE